MEKTSIHIVLCGTQLHMSAVRKLSSYKSNLFYVKSTSTVDTLPDMDKSDWSYSVEDIVPLFKPNPNADITVAIIEHKLEHNYFALRLTDKSGVITFYEADAILRDVNVDVFNYLLLMVYKMITIYIRASNKFDENSLKPIHDETRGCLFDMTGNKCDLVHSASKAHLCQSCGSYLSEKDMPIDYVSVLKKELKKIRKSKYNLLIDFIKGKPILSLIIAIISTVIINILSSFIYQVISLI